MLNNFPQDIVALKITQDNDSALLLLIGKAATNNLPNIEKHYVNHCELYRNLEAIRPFCEDNLFLSAVSKKIFSCNLKNYKYAVVAFDNDDEPAVKFAESISLFLKNEGLLVISATVDTYDSGNRPGRTEPPLEISRKNVIDSADALVIANLEIYSENISCTELFSRMIITIIDLYLDCDEENLILKDIKNSGIGYYSETFSSDFLPFEELEEKAVFDSLFQCPYYVAANVFCSITHGNSWNSSDCCEKLFLSIDNYLNPNAAFSVSADCVSFLSDNDMRFQFLFFGFDGKSSVFNDNYSYAYPDFPNSEIKEKLEFMLNNYCEDI